MTKTVGMVLALLVLAGCSSEPYDPDNESEARAQCESFAKDRLKSPASADFSLGAARDSGGWVVTGTVDSENSFGANLRSDVRCVLHFSGDQAYLDDIS